MKLELNSQLLILTNDVQVLIFCLTYFITTVSSRFKAEEEVIYLDEMNSCGGANAHFWFGFLSSTQCTALLPVQFQCPNSTLLSITWWRLETSRKLNLKRLC